MEQFKNIILGFLIAVVLCLGYKVYTLETRISESHVHSAADSNDKMFNQFLHLVKELKKLEQEDAK